MAIWQKVSNTITKKFNSELIYSKKYLIAEKRFNTARKLIMFFYTS